MLQAEADFNIVDINFPRHKAHGEPLHAYCQISKVNEGQASQ